MAFNKAKAMEEAEKCLGQGRTAQAIKLYLAIFEKEPTDLGILNTVGDLYVRDKNMPEALKYFHKLADSYTQEGFTLKAIAIYKKIVKVDPAAVDVLLKTAELYMVQGLSREAREQYTGALEFYKKKNQNDKALEIFRKIVAVDPENTVYRVRLADFCESVGKKTDAAQVYLETVEIGLRRGDLTAAENALKKVLALDPQNSQLPLLRVRLAFAKKQPEEAEKLFEANPALKSDPRVRQLLLDSYLGSHNFGAAEDLVVEVFRANPDDFSPLASYADLCLANENIEAAFRVLAKVADPLIDEAKAGPLMEVLRRIWAKSANHLPTLELIRKIAEKTGDEYALPEVLDALGNAYVAAGELEKAEAIYRKLLERQPEDEQINALLKQVLQKEGKEQPVARAQDLASAEMALTVEGEPTPVGSPVAVPGAAEEAAAVKEALDNSDLFARYGLTDKAFAELDKALSLYPNQMELHRRVFEIAQKGDPARAAQAAKAMARIYADRGDSASAKKYEQLGEASGAPATPEAPPEAPPAPPPEAPAPAPMEFDLSGEFLAGAATETLPPPPAPSPAHDFAADLTSPAAPETSPPAPQGIEFDLSAPVAAEPTATTTPVQEFDLSGGWEASTTAAPPEAPPVAPPAAAGFNYEDSKIEVEYYLDQGFLDEAGNAVRALEEKFPGDSKVAELRQLVDQRTAPQEAPQPAAPAEPAPAAPPEEEWELPTSFAEAPPVEVPVAPPPAPEPPLEAPVQAAPEAAPEAGGLGGLMEGLEESLAGIETTPPAAPASAAAPEAPKLAAEPPAPSSLPSPLSGLLEELGEGDHAQAVDDPQTHYDLGVAFREMNLLDEAIGEFQKVVRGVQKGKYPPNFLQACTLLAVCFMDKKLPAIAAKWYLRALEFPDLDEEATMAVQYDLGLAYEQAGDKKSALEKFSEVYSQNIDYRDVAEKIRLLQTKS
ncbi:MAG: tetratricopeptide repeat protein [Terriglobia bacterium]|jgi:tetratricopeptide (TPR) repeat protein